MRILRVASIFLCLAFAAPAGADDFTGWFGWGARAGGDYPAGPPWIRHNGNADFTGGAWMRYGVSPKFSFGMTADHVSFGASNPGLQSVLADGYYHLMPESRWNPNVHMGVGVANSINNERQDGTAFTTRLGAGGDYLIHRQISVGAFLDYQFATEGHGASTKDPSHEMHALLYGLTVGLWFGGDHAAPVRPRPVELKPRAPVDSDGDGVLDSSDRCPGTSPGTAIDAAGCPADADRDGVLDTRDQCPGSPIGTEVNALGCPKEEKVSIELLIEFDTAKWEVKKTYDDQLRKVAEFLEAHPEAKAEIEGHTDSKGSRSYNMALSKKRAAAVRKALIDRFGVGSGRLSSEGYGPTKPVADNDEEEGRAKNRRVLATFSGMK